MATNPKEYTNLRTLLDSLQVGALRYYLSGTGMSAPKKYQYIHDQLMPIIDDLWSQEALIDCPPGYYDCDGCCVPYKCPEIFSLAKRKKPAKKSKRKR